MDMFKPLNYSVKLVVYCLIPQTYPSRTFLAWSGVHVHDESRNMNIDSIKHSQLKYEQILQSLSIPQASLQPLM